MSHTFAVLEVSKNTFKEISDKLRTAGYDQAFFESIGDVPAIDMHGLALVVATPSPASLPILPAPGSKKQSELIDIELAKRAWPANNRNAGRAGWDACLAAIALATPQPSGPVEAQEQPAGGS